MKRFLMVCMLMACTVNDTDPDDTGNDEDATALPLCGGDGTFFQSCNYDCDCAGGNVCRYNYAGGYLAECTSECATDADCEAGTCSGGWCVQLCAEDFACTGDTWCYPGTLVDGTLLTDPQHPDPHCMPKACRQIQDCE